MKIYDAKNNQSCKLCEYKTSHNKQGWFTLHLKNYHNLSLEEYLLRYYYFPEDLKCSYILCQNTVGLYRGKPKKYCSAICSGRSKGKPLTCIICGNKFDTSTRPNRATKTCSKSCAKKLKSAKIKQWHKSMHPEEKEKHFRKIITKTAKTRKRNNTPSWNSGKTGVYSKETIEKIRASTLKQMENEKFQKTRIEKIMESYLIEINVNYKYSFILEKRQYDFCLMDFNLIIECDGDYWHANPKYYPNPENWQIERIHMDREKNVIAKNHGYQIVRFWEDDIINNFDYIKSILHDLLATT
ncbi:endonuclease domain-containing protein [Gracilibacillus sp. HCP3S3_G5_1]|uniref:endonuclease domain-containing protein n=1 Tax=unclassified Gracilibacillus TaxID=2625209 RepID=UPI003F89590D